MWDTRSVILTSFFVFLIFVCGCLLVWGCRHLRLSRSRSAFDLDGITSCPDAQSPTHSRIPLLEPGTPWIVPQPSPRKKKERRSRMSLGMLIGLTSDERRWSELPCSPPPAYSLLEGEIHTTDAGLLVGTCMTLS